MQRQLSLEGDESFQANQNIFDSGSAQLSNLLLGERIRPIFTLHPTNTIEHFESRLSGAVSDPFEFDVQNPWRGQAGPTESTPAIFHPLSNDVEPFQASPWLFEGENSGFGAVPTPGSTTNLFLGEVCRPLDAQAELKPSDQDLGFGIPLPGNHWNSCDDLKSQLWGISTGQNHTSVPIHATTCPVTFANNFMTTGFDTNSYAQSINCSAPDSYFDLQASNVPAIGPHSLDFFSMDVGQTSFKMLMPAPGNSQELVFGSGGTFSDPTVYQDLLQNNSVASLPNGNTFDVAGFQHAQVPQASQDEAHTLPGPTTILNQPNPAQQLAARASTFACAHSNCNQAFRRKSDLDRHRKTVHDVNHIKFFCHIPGCPKGRGHGEGYSRNDKLTEHLWKKHGTLGYTKSR